MLNSGTVLWPQFISWVIKKKGLEWKKKSGQERKREQQLLSCKSPDTGGVTQLWVNTPPSCSLTLSILVYVSRPCSEAKACDAFFPARWVFFWATLIVSIFKPKFLRLCSEEGVIWFWELIIMVKSFFKIDNRCVFRLSLLINQEICSTFLFSVLKGQLHFHLSSFICTRQQDWVQTLLFRCLFNCTLRVFVCIS